MTGSPADGDLRDRKQQKWTASDLKRKRKAEKINLKKNTETHRPWYLSPVEGLFHAKPLKALPPPYEAGIPMLISERNKLRH